ncbi:hypothetical protein Acaty_c0676 [Acidithiobacillus caldus ATCC 51756]|uniref:Uncharacterized protein n=1 Tax=Acidithiobacillus caldus (strain ATCC 51756 / DSM 8584 / KU) TaxID=637389 RepID=A0A059ZX45_ACICK|nr:hypothetical protein Acaty_c0676 [Acidithiobacillus caldus ATCC 51756]QER44848.1 hypothetical protein F0726_01784 [Acidithiobacillus caldus]
MRPPYCVLPVDHRAEKRDAKCRELPFFPAEGAQPEHCPAHRTPQYRPKRLKSLLNTTQWQISKPSTTLLLRGNPAPSADRRHHDELELFYLTSRKRP